MKKTIVHGLLLAIIFLAPQAHAATGMSASELRIEIARLTRVADSIRAQLLTYGNDPSTVTSGATGTSYTGTGCLQTNVRMEQGTSGGSVRTLQQFLVTEGVYSASLVTSYFGPATQAGVQRWQASHGVVSYGTPETTGYGKVGPSTLRAMQAGCSGGSYSGTSGSLSGSNTNTTYTTQSTVAVERYTLSLNPTRGLAPLNVTAEFSITGSTCTSYLLDWGDGSLPVSYNSNKSTGCISSPINIIAKHIYTTGGEYVVRFKNGKAPITQIKQVSELKVEVVGS